MANLAGLYRPEPMEPSGYDQSEIDSTGSWEAAKASATTGWYATANLAIRANEKLGIYKLTGQQDRFLTSDEYDESDYKRPGLKFPDGVHETLANEEAQRFDTKVIREDLISRSRQTKGAKLARFGAGIAGGFANPLFWTVGGAVGRVFASAASAFSELIPEIKALSPAFQTLVKKGMAEGGVIMPAFQAIDEVENKLHQGEFHLLNVAKAALPGALFGIAAGSIYHGVSEVISARSPNLKSDFAKKAGITKPRENASTESVQPVDQEDHEQMMGAAISQMENNKTPDVTEIAKQSYYNKWMKNFGDDYKADPEAFQRSIDEVRKNTEHDQTRLDKIENEIKKIPEDSPKIDELRTEKESLEKAIDHQKLIADMKSEIPEMPGDTDVNNYINKMNSPTSDFSHLELKPRVDLKDPDVAADELLKDTQEKFNNVKDSLPEKIKEDADTSDIKQKHKGIKTFYDMVRDCIVRGEA